MRSRFIIIVCLAITCAAIALCIVQYLFREERVPGTKISFDNRSGKQIESMEILNGIASLSLKPMENGGFPEVVMPRGDSGQAQVKVHISFKDGGVLSDSIYCDPAITVVIYSNNLNRVIRRAEW